MNSDPLAVLEKLAAIGGEHHDAYLVELRKYNSCMHLRTQTYTEHCMDCGYNTWYGPDPEEYLKKAMTPDPESEPQRVLEKVREHLNKLTIGKLREEVMINPPTHLTYDEAMKCVDQIEHAKLHQYPEAQYGYYFACRAMRELIEQYFIGRTK